MKLKLKERDRNTMARSAVEFAESLDLGISQFDDLASDGRKRTHLYALEAMGYVSFRLLGKPVKSWGRDEERLVSVQVGHADN